MNDFFNPMTKPMQKLGVLFSISLALHLTGCGSTLNTRDLEVNLEQEYSNGFYERIDTVLIVRSLESEAVTINQLQVNNGQCSYSHLIGNPVKFPKQLEIGQSLKVYLKCHYDSVVKVDIETDQGVQSYSFK